MAPLGIASAFLLLLATDGFRVRRKRTAKPSSESVSKNTPNQFPASPACLLASGFGVQRGCQYPAAMKAVGECGSSWFESACYENSNAETVRGYMKDVRSTSDYNSMTRSVTEAEGGGFGVSVSASFSYMKRSQVTEKSLAFFIGASGTTQTRSIKNPGELKLTSAASSLLRSNPREFIARYGLRYIHSITYGGSFLGSVTLNSKNTVDERDIEAMAGFSVNKGLWSVSGSTEFQNKMSSENLDISTFINAQWVGGSNISQDYQTPATLNAMFEAWDGSWRENPAPITVITRRWIDSVDVQSIINSMSAADKELFNVPDVSGAMSSEISNENAQLALVDASLRRALVWNEIQSDSTRLSCLNSLSRDVSAQLMRIDLLTDSDVLIIQQQWLAGNYSWFVANSLNARYLSCVDGVTPPTPAPTPVPTPAPTTRDCNDIKKNPCTAHPIDWYQPKCTIHGSGYREVGWEHCSAIFGGRYLCQKLWTCSQRHDAPNCCR